MRRKASKAFCLFEVLSLVNTGFVWVTCGALSRHFVQFKYRYKTEYADSMQNIEYEKQDRMLSTIFIDICHEHLRHFKGIEFMRTL